MLLVVIVVGSVGMGMKMTGMLVGVNLFPQIKGVLTVSGWSRHSLSRARGLGLVSELGNEHVVQITRARCLDVCACLHHKLLSLGRLLGPTLIESLAVDLLE
jgi:hypothetical protein